MEPGKSLVPRESSGLFPGAQQWQTMSQIAEVLVKSNLLPAHIKTQQAALAVMLKGAELGVPAMQALCSIVVVQGKPTCNAELMLALSYRDHGDDAIIITETTAECCTISYKRRGWKERQTYSFTMDDARRAGLAEAATWKKYPQAMLRARAISAVCRMAFPDSIAGMYVYEEMGLPVDVDAGEQVVVDGSAGNLGAAVAHREQAWEATKAAIEHDLATAGQREGPTAVGREEALREAPSPPTANGHGKEAADPFVEVELAMGDAPAGAEETAAQWTREQLSAAVQQLGGVSVSTLAHWQDLARTYGLPVPSVPKERTQPWFLALYQAMQTQRVSERLRQANDSEEIRACMMDAIGLRDRREISTEQYCALDVQADNRYAQLASPSAAQAS